MNKPTHYLVIRSPYAEAILTGVKSIEFRSWSERLEGKTVAVAVAKSRTDPDLVESQIEYWDAGRDKAKLFRALVKRKPQAKIIGSIEFGKSAEFPEHYLEKGVEIKSFELWEEKDWVPSAGGLGLRPL